jgi:hypothetical protein
MLMKGDYRCEAKNLGGFVQQLAVSYVARGYWFYVTGSIPERKDPAAVDAKLIERYQLGLSSWTRARRKRAGLANAQYLRLGRFFVLLATPGKHRFFEDEAASLRDVRRVPIKFCGYSIGYRQGHPSVRIEPGEYKRLKAHFLELATKLSAERLEARFRALGFEPYAPIRGQLLCIHRAVNRRRKVAGLRSVEACFCFKRRIYRPFEPEQPLGKVPGGLLAESQQNASLMPAMKCDAS